VFVLFCYHCSKIHSVICGHWNIYIFVNLEIYIAESFIQLLLKWRDFGNPTILLED
jgi:hypothetical protein